MTLTAPGSWGATPAIPDLRQLAPTGGDTKAPTLRVPGGDARWRPAPTITPARQADAEYSMHDPNFFRDDDWQFGHDGDTYHLDRYQQGTLVRTASGTKESNPQLVEGVQRLEQQAGTSVGRGGSGHQPGDYRGYSGYSSGHSGRSHYYGVADFVRVDDRTTDRRAYEFQRSGMATTLVAGAQELDKAHGTTIEGTDGGEVGGWEKVGKVAVPVAVAVALAGVAYLMRGGRYR